jgi:hypothetical protein
MAKINTKEIIDLEVEKLLEKKDLTYKISIGWIILEALTMIIVLMYLVMSLWTTYNWGVFVKILIIGWIVTVFYDVFYNFIWTRYIVLIETEESK